jgi:hypothetical protein
VTGYLHPTGSISWKSCHMPSHTLRSTSTASCAVSRWLYPPESALLTARNVLKERPLARGLSSLTAREGYGLAAGMCAGCGVHKVHQRRPTSSQPPLQGRHPRANRGTLIDPIPTVLSQVTAACAVFIASRGRAPPPHRPKTGVSGATGGRTRTWWEVEGDVLKCLRLDIQPGRTRN